jgi:hypothetical protein
MKRSNNSLGTASLIMFAAGIFIGIGIAGGIIWGDLEASSFSKNIKPTSSLRLNCPVVIAKHEVGEVSAKLKNPTEREQRFYVRTHISEGHVERMREINQHITVAPGEKEKVVWEIYPEDAAYRRFIFFRTYVFAAYPLPSQGNFCGVLVLDIPLLTGTQFFLLMLGLSLAGTICGSLIWQNVNQPMDHVIRNLTNANHTLAVLVFSTILAGYLGFWILGSVLFAVSILLVVILLGSYYTTRL